MLHFQEIGMGGTGFGLKIERTGEGLEPQPLLHHIWKAVENTVYYRLKARANNAVTHGYFHENAYDGIEDGIWSASETELDFVFKDYAGCCGMSASVSHHWTELSLAWWGFRNAGPSSPGWRIHWPTDLRRQITFGPRYPVVHLGKGMGAVARREEPPSDEDEAAFQDDKLVTWGSLSKTDRDKVDLSTRTGMCQCDVCTVMRKSVLAPALRPKLKRDVGAVRAAWTLLEAAPDRRAGATESLAAWDCDFKAIPDALQVLCDSLEQEGAALGPYLLAGMLETLRRRDARRR